MQRILQNHVLANLMFVLVMVMGVSSYLLMPREQDPSINFNWININTIYPGAAAPDVEKQVTNVLEDAIRQVADIKFVSSTSREGISSIVVRFEEISPRVFEKRIADLRREIESADDALPDATLSPFIFEVTTDNAFPSATIVIGAVADDENLRRQATLIKQDIEQIKGVSNVLENGLSDPEIHIIFNPELLEQYGLSPISLADTIRLYYKNTSAGSLNVAKYSWAVKITGSRYDLEHLGNLPLVTSVGEITLKEVASIIQSKEPARQLVSFNQQPAVLLAITKQHKQNVLQLVERLSDFIAQGKPLFARNGITVTLVDDQTQITKDALSVMQTNALIGLFMVLVVTWIFMGSQIALLTGIAIPFILAGTFWFLSSIGQTLNVNVLLGVVISLGMLVDDAVVVVEAIYYRLQRGASTLNAAVQGLMEVITPVTTAVLTTMAAFLPLMLLPGILGKYMLIIPMVVTVALAISLIEAYWLLPAHVIAFKIDFNHSSRVHALRERLQHTLRLVYIRTLIKVFRHPIIALSVLLLLFSGAIGVAAFGKIKFDFFASDPVRLFYVNVQMPPGSALRTTMDKVLEVEVAVISHIESGESRSVVSYAGQMVTQIEPFFGDQYGQILVSLVPKTKSNRTVDQIIEAMQAAVMAITGIEQVSFLRIAGGPPVSKPINVKVRGDERTQIMAATAQLKQFMFAQNVFTDIADDNVRGQNTLDLTINSAAVQRTGITPDLIARTLRLLVDGEIVTSFRHLGEKVDIRLKANNQMEHIDRLLEYRLPANNPSATPTLIPLNQLVTAEYTRSANTIRHYNYRRNITLEADIDKTLIDTIQANALIKQHWQTIRHRFPNITLDFSGALDDIEESIDAIGLLFLMGLGLIYLILGTQFRSYFQPFLIIMTVPMAATGVIFGLLITQYPLSLFTLYGVVALAGIAVNAAIVLISAANSRLKDGMSVTNAIIFASRRRVIPILITSLTTISGLFSLATGLGGHSLLWGPVAASMVWGLVVSTTLTLFFIPLCFRLAMRRRS